VACPEIESDGDQAGADDGAVRGSGAEGRRQRGKGARSKRTSPGQNAGSLLGRERNPDPRRGPLASIIACVPPTAG
jgi:hypothetical protein